MDIWGASLRCVNPFRTDSRDALSAFLLMRGSIWSRRVSAAREARPVYDRMFETAFSEQIRNEAEVATMCVGNITTADQVNTILAGGRADIAALGRPHLVDPSFTMKAAARYRAPTHRPLPYQPGKIRYSAILFVNARSWKS
jgi:2,4-dienoyl-CoA reductase-like NADH-dependent reductase (Old Yellow Enzyme family)